MLTAITERVSAKKDELLNTYRHTLREKAIHAAKSRIVLAGKGVGEFTEDELESIVSEEEDKIIQNLKAGSILALLIALGIS
jgi:hypothetical protein